MKKRVGVWVGIIAVALGWLAFGSERVVVAIAVSNEQRSNFLRLSAGRLPASTTDSSAGSSFSLNLASGGGITADLVGDLPEGRNVSKDHGMTCWSAGLVVNVAKVGHAGAKT